MFLIVFVVLFGVFLHFTIYGRRIYAIGTNPDAARHSGISITRHRIGLFALTGFMCGLAAILLTSRLGSVRLNIATGWNFRSSPWSCSAGSALPAEPERLSA